MDHDERPRRGIDPEAVQRELEEVQQALEESRQRRRQASDAFESFVRSFTRPSPVVDDERASARRAVPPDDSRPWSTEVAPPPTPPAPPPPFEATPPPVVMPASPTADLNPPVPEANPFVPEVGAMVEAEPIVPDESPFVGDVDPLASEVQPIVSDFEKLEIPEPQTPLPSVLRPESPPLLPQPHSAPLELRPAVPAALMSGSPKHRRPLIYGIVAAVIVVALVAIGWSVQPRDAPLNTVRRATPPVSAPTTGTAPQPAPEPVPAAELTTTRAVWVRVSVDGEVALERELPPNARIPLKATQQISIRVGDAGGLRVAIAGKDQGSLGGDGQVVTRTFKIAGEPVK